MDGYGIQVSVKPNERPMVNVRGSNPADFDAHMDHVIATAGKILLLQQIFDTPAGVPLIQQELGGRVVEEYPAPPPQPQYADYPPQAPPQWPQAPVGQPAPPVAQPTYPMSTTYCQRCQKAPVCSTCGRPGVVPPKSVKNGQYYIHECPSGDRDHKGPWCNLPKS